MFKSLAGIAVVLLLSLQPALAQSAPDSATPAEGAVPSGAPEAAAPESSPAPAQPAATGNSVAVPTLPFVLDARVSSTPERGRLVVDLSSPTAFAIVRLDQPDRIAVDVRASELQLDEVAPVAGEGSISSYTIEALGPDRIRTMLTLTTPMQVQQAYVLDPFADQPARLVVDLVPATAEEFARQVAADLAASTAAQSAALPATPTQPGGSNIVSASRPLVVIDPGHGGVDNGASSANGIREKDIVLAFALRLQELLMQSGRFDVALTREDDSFLRLDERVALARANKADLFISIHADSFQQSDIRGASVYTRDENASDILDKILADQENKRDLVAGFSVAAETADSVVDILVELMRREVRKLSYMAAQSIVSQLEPSVELRRFPVRQADFFVLQAPDVPSILVELGFLSNATDIANLQAGDWQDRSAEALARGISAYFDSLASTPE